MQNRRLQQLLKSLPRNKIKRLVYGETATGKGITEPSNRVLQQRKMLKNKIGSTPMSPHLGTYSNLLWNRLLIYNPNKCLVKTNIERQLNWESTRINNKCLVSDMDSKLLKMDQDVGGSSPPLSIQTVTANLNQEWTVNLKTNKPSSKRKDTYSNIIKI